MSDEIIEEEIASDEEIPKGKSDSSGVADAFSSLMKAIDNDIKYVNSKISSLALKGENSSVYDLNQEAIQKKDFKEKAENLKKEWLSISRTNAQARPTEKRTINRLPSGSRTSRHEFILPILLTLTETGGTSTADEILKSVAEKMKSKLQDVDYEPMPSSRSNTPRWVDSVYQARNFLLKEELLKTGSERGVWELSPKGEDYVKANAEQN